MHTRQDVQKSPVTLKETCSHVRTSGAENIQGDVRLADVSGETSMLYRWQAYNDSPVAGMNLVLKLDGQVWPIKEKRAS